MLGRKSRPSVAAKAAPPEDTTAAQPGEVDAAVTTTAAPGEVEAAVVTTALPGEVVTAARVPKAAGDAKGRGKGQGQRCEPC